MRRLLALTASTAALVPTGRAPLRPRLHRLSAAAADSGQGSSPTVAEAAAAAAATLAAAGVPEAETNAWLLVGSAAGIAGGVGAVRSFGAAPFAAQAALDGYVAQRGRREPLQYIVGDWDFHDITVAVRAPVLVPRPETEELVELALAGVRRWGGDSAPVRILDVGAGTGCIGLAMLKALGPRASCVAVEPCPTAAALAEENAAALGLSDRYGVRRCAVGEFGDGAPGVFDVIVSNPPYIPSADMAGLEPEVREWEARTALDGGPDGLDVLRDLVAVAPRLLSDGGARSVYLELDPTHPSALADEFGTAADVEGGVLEGGRGRGRAGGPAVTGAWRDFAGHARFVRLGWDNDPHEDE